MVLRVVVGIGDQHIVLAAEMLEHVEHRLGVAAGGGEVAQACLVGARFFGAAVGQRAAVRGLGRARCDGDAGAGGSCDHGGGGAEHADGGDAAGAAQVLVAANLVAAGDVAEFVRDDRADLVHAAEFGQEPGVYEDVLAAGDEGIRLGIGDDVEPDGGGVHPGRTEERVCDALERRLDLGVADQAQRRGRHASEGQNGRRDRSQHPHPAASPCRLPLEPRVSGLAVASRSPGDARVVIGLAGGEATSHP